MQIQSGPLIWLKLFKNLPLVNLGETFTPPTPRGVDQTARGVVSILARRFQTYRRHFPR